MGFFIFEQLDFEWYFEPLFVGIHTIGLSGTGSSAFGVGFGVVVGFGVGDGVGLAVGVGSAVGVGLGVGVGAAVGVGLAVGSGASEGLEDGIAEEVGSAVVSTAAGILLGSGVVCDSTLSSDVTSEPTGVPGVSAVSVGVVATAKMKKTINANHFIHVLKEGKRALIPAAIGGRITKPMRRRNKLAKLNGLIDTAPINQNTDRTHKRIFFEPFMIFIETSYNI